MREGVISEGGSAVRWFNGVGGVFLNLLVSWRFVRLRGFIFGGGWRRRAGGLGFVF